MKINICMRMLITIGFVFLLPSCGDKDGNVKYQPLSYYAEHLEEAKVVSSDCVNKPPKINKAKANCFNAETALHLRQ